MALSGLGYFLAIGKRIHEIIRRQKVGMNCFILGINYALHNKIYSKGDDFDCFRNRGYISAVYSKRLSGPGQFLAKNKFCLDPLTPSKVIVST